ncbi:hypothetical protein FE36_09395 [Xanthomonas oryzae pv. oryzicola]|uniref:hypothetical protein n=1 Tax=Xanthomonas oryzae TaxID=347 RepID=UPI0006552D7A|nr:hypothetical protein [Xanthomonas oryzae]AKK64028.1 hypothetical protein FE36_09395 [Xanthomonas oryzae pv. oryzicola]
MIARPLYALLATLALGACPHAAGGAAPATVTETSALSSSSPATVPPDKPTAEGLLGQLLVLIKGSQTISDFTPERLKSAMGQVVQFVKDDERLYRAFGRLTKEWSYCFGEKRGQVLRYPHVLKHQRHLLAHCVGQRAQAF